MTAASKRIARGVALGAVVVAWALAAHYTTALVDSSSWGALLGLAPFAVVSGAFAWRSPRRPAMLALLAIAGAGLALAWPRLAENVGWMYFVQHVGTNALLGVAFGRTLFAGRQPMCTRFAAIIHGELDAAVARYTRRVTQAWTFFFGAMASVSALLFALAPIEVWSTFANLLTLPLVALMFVGEYAVRLRALPAERQGGILDGIRAYRTASAAVEASAEAEPAAAQR